MKKRVDENGDKVLVEFVVNERYWFFDPYGCSCRWCQVRGLRRLLSRKAEFVGRWVVCNSAVRLEDSLGSHCSQ